MKHFALVLKPILTFAIVPVVVFSLAACGDKQAGSNQEMMLSLQSSKFINTDVTSLGYARDFSLTDHNRKLRTLADFKGKAVVVFFGFTQFHDVCPTNMAEMASVIKELGRKLKSPGVIRHG